LNFLGFEAFQLSKSCGRSLKERSLTFKKRISKNDSSNGKCDLALSNQTPQLHIKTIKLLKSGRPMIKFMIPLNVEGCEGVGEQSADQTTDPQTRVQIRIGTEQSEAEGTLGEQVHHSHPMRSRPGQQFSSHDFAAGSAPQLQIGGQSL
jgi:hypothetical protein